MRHSIARMPCSSPPFRKTPTLRKTTGNPSARSNDFAVAQRNGQSTAIVTQRNGHIVAAQFVFQNQFGDALEKADYCFHSDGSLAALRSELTSYHQSLGLRRDRTYDSTGKVISNQQSSWDLTTHKPRPIPSDFWDLPPPVFLHVSDLPFAKDLPGFGKTNPSGKG